MTTPFAATLERPEAETSGSRPLLTSDIRFCFEVGHLARGRGETSGSMAAPFARFAAKTTFPISGAGATTYASAPTDTTTYTSGTPGQHGEPWADDSHLDDR